MPKLARECLAGNGVHRFWRKNASDAFAYGRLGFSRARGLNCREGAHAHSQGTLEHGRKDPPDAISPTVNRIQQQ